jgi:uncharacterized protein YbjT (DUF2867 family)
MILVAGGTGTLGTQLVRTLTARGDRTRVLTRQARPATSLREAGVDVVIGDVRTAAALAAAVQGCTTVISAVHGFVGARGVSPASVDRDGNRNLIRAAVDAGVDHMVLVSVQGAAATHPMSLHRMKYAAEQSLVDSGLTWTVLRSVPFIETWLKVIGGGLTARGRALVPGPGTNPINMVSVLDVADVINHAVHDPAWRNRRVDVTGPANLTFRQIAEQLVATHEGSGRISHIPLTALRVMAELARPAAPAFARQARAAVVMNTTDMTAGPETGSVPARQQGAVTLDQLLRDPGYQRA